MNLLPKMQLSIINLPQSMLILNLGINLLQNMIDIKFLPQKDHLTNIIMMLKLPHPQEEILKPIHQRKIIKLCFRKQKLECVLTKDQELED